MKYYIEASVFQYNAEQKPAADKFCRFSSVAASKLWNIIVTSFDRIINFSIPIKIEKLHHPS